MSRHLPEGKDRIDEYGRWPTVWPAPQRGDAAGWRPHRLLGWLRTLVWAVVFLVGVPAGLWWAFDDPRRRVGTGSELWEWADHPNSRLSGDMLIDAAIWVVWLGWAALALLLLGELVAAVTRLRLPMPHAPRHLRRLVFGLAGTTVVTVASTARTMPAVVAAPAEATPVPAATVSALPPTAGPATIQVAAVRYRYVVQRHDTLSKIARDWLGDERRWPEICRLNRHRHFPRVGGTLRDCDLIYPGWDLKLPADATPPPEATRQPPPPEPHPHGAKQPSPAPPQSTPAPDDGVAEAPHNPPTTAPSAAATTAPAAAPAPTATPTPTPSEAGAWPPTTSPGTTSPPADTETDAAPSTDHDGVRLPGGSFVPWTLAAATAIAWLHRRRRFTPAGDAEPGQLPAPVVELHRQVARNPDLPTPADLAERATAAPAVPLLPPGGIGLVGDGAHAAARAALVTYLASGGPHDPDRRGEVVIDGTTLTTLLGADAADLAPWPRLHVADNLDHALSILDVRLLHRARVLDEHSLTDLNSLHEHAPDEEALPPILLITEPPPPAAQMRARVTFGLGADLGVTALLLGPWPPGSTITISSDGHTRLVGGPAVEGFDGQVGVLDTADAAAILTTLREAHTGQPPARTLPTATPSPSPAPAAEADTGRDAEPAQPPPNQPAVVSDRRPGTKVRLRVLGTPTIDNITLPGRPLRSKAAELAVYLACHPDGADTATIAEHLVPDARLRAAKQQVHTNASNLRHVLGRAGGPRPGGYVLKHGPNARYRLDPASIDVDLWQLHDLLQRARLASLPVRADLLRQACNLYRAPLANGCDYDWVEPHREKARLWGIEAHLLYAEDLLKTDPQAASDLLDKAIALDRYNEQLYRTAMQARHALGDTDGIRTLLRALTKALADLDTEPDHTTTELAHELQARLRAQPGTGQVAPQHVTNFDH